MKNLNHSQLPTASIHRSHQQKHYLRGPTQIIKRSASTPPVTLLSAEIVDLPTQAISKVNLAEVSLWFG